ncbi:uncharacterized protein LOC124255711 [Haliotis rubra]|uniref:uncharacterized protein LOC124255711 n=1 Tax=Haliotis rubra TaxID=36100 RepID=UPI001EE5B03B|nr:uncharacterized protein LOC124255711 [Haliotis rubra]
MDEADEDLDSKTDRHTSRLFDLCVPEQNDGQGDGSPNRSHEWSPRDVQPPEQHSSPETGLQIPLLVSTKRRERPVRGVRNARRSNYRDYQVTFVDDVQFSDPCRYSEPETVSSSRATISDTRVWTVKNNGVEGCPANNKHGFSRSETHQEYRDAHVRDNSYPANQRIELSAHSEPFIPRWRVSDENSFMGCESEKRLNKIEEELTDMRTSPQQRHENQNSLSPRSQPLLLKTPSPEQMKRSPVGDHELQFQLDDNDHHQQSLVCNVQSDEFLNSPESHKSAESYQQWSPAHDSEESPVKEYELFDTKKSFYDNSLLDRVQPITSVGKSASKPCGLIGNMKFTGNGWKKIYEKGNTVDDLWNIWSSHSETKTDVKDQSWTNGDAKLLKPLSTSFQCSVNDLQPTPTSVPTTVWQRTSQSVWTKPEAPVQSQYTYVPNQSHLTPRSVRSSLASYSRTSQHQSSMPSDKSDQIPPGTNNTATDPAPAGTQTMYRCIPSWCFGRATSAPVSDISLDGGRAECGDESTPVTRQHTIYSVSRNGCSSTKPKHLVCVQQDGVCADSSALRLPQYGGSTASPETARSQAHVAANSFISWVRTSTFFSQTYHISHVWTVSRFNPPPSPI